MTTSAAPSIQRVAVLGSTGSVGVNTLDVIARHPEQFQVVALAAGQRVQPLLEQCRRWLPEFAVMADADSARQLAQACRAEGLETEVLAGSQAVTEIAGHARVDTVMAAIVGAAGLRSALRAAQAGKRLLLANKEALVVGGRLFMEAVAGGGGSLLPIDSEHSAIFQALPEDRSAWDARIDRLILTASGGPFRERDPETLHEVTPEQACAHPNWVMGRKISVDSATMMNKALEVIEACYLFGVPPERIEVVVHPQSVIHSMVQFRDHSIVAQLGTPDMRVPIACGLAWPRRIASGAAALDFASVGAMTFEPADSAAHRRRFPGLRLAWEALEAAPGTTAVLNAANEVAVAAFLERRLRFDRIHGVNAATLEQVRVAPARDIDDLLALDAESRRVAESLVQRLAG